MEENNLKEINLDDLKSWTEREWFNHISQEFEECFGKPLVLKVCKLPAPVPFKWMASCWMGDISAGIATGMGRDRKEAIGNLNSILDNMIYTIHDMEDYGFTQY